MIKVLAGIDPGSDVADAGTVKVSSVGDVASTTKLSELSYTPYLTYDNSPHLFQYTRIKQ